MSELLNMLGPGKLQQTDVSQNWLQAVTQPLEVAKELVAPSMAGALLRDLVPQLGVSNRVAVEGQKLSKREDQQKEVGFA